jgi:C1A family cysteine protease
MTVNPQIKLQVEDNMKIQVKIISLFFSVLAFCFSALADNGVRRNANETSPASWDNLDGLPPVGNQVVSGSCYAWATAYYYLTYLQWQEYGWDVTDPAHQCSPALVYNLTNGGVDDGAWEGHNARADSFKVFETMGCATMADMPYSYRAYQTFPSEAAFRNGMRFRALSTHQITTRSDSGIQAIKDHLIAGKIAVLGIYGYNNLNNINSYNNTYCVSQTTGPRLYWHEVTVIGFDDSMATADGVGAFHLVNSWGTGWGDNGFFWMSYEAVKHTRTSYGYVMYATDRIGYEPSFTARIEVGHSDRYNLIYEAGFGDPNSPDTLLTFFDFHPMSLQVGVPYPEGAFVLDITDMENLIQHGSNNEIFLRIEDDRPNNGHAGVIKSLMIEDLPGELCASSLNIPIPILDASVGSEETVILDYSFSSPQNLNAVLDSLNGFVQLSWNAHTETFTLNAYRIYLDGRLVDSTSSPVYGHFLSLRGVHYYGVSALSNGNESPAAMTNVLWTGPSAFGIPFADDFENGFGGWYQIGSSGIPSVITEDPVYEGQYAAGIKTYPSDYTALLRDFPVTAGADVETWFFMEGYPSLEGVCGSVLLAEGGMIFGTFFDGGGHPGYIYSISPYQLIPVQLDSILAVNLNEWYKQKIWCFNGKLQFMLLDNQSNVILNRVANIVDQNINQVGVFAQGLSGDWNYFDEFSIRQWNDLSLQHFAPVDPTDAPYALIINEASVDTGLLQTGDEIAVFDGDVCVGAVIVDGEWPLEMNSWEADSSGPGFVHGNMIRARIWRNQSNLEYETDITFEVGDGTFGNGIFSRLSLIATQVVAVQRDEAPVPKNFTISQPYPNPFNPTTTLEITLPEYSNVEVTVYNILGQKVAILADDHFDVGIHRFRFDAESLSSGIYFIHASVTGKISRIHKVLLVK